MSIPRYRRSRFDSGEDNLLDPLANLADAMLVFAVGLMVALAASQKSGLAPAEQTVDVSTGRQVPELPPGAGEAGSGYEAVGRVYRDKETGRLILMSSD